MELVIVSYKNMVKMFLRNSMAPIEKNWKKHQVKLPDYILSEPNMKKHTQPFEYESYEDEPIGVLSWSLIIIGGVVVTLCIADVIFGGEVVTEALAGLIS